MMVAVLSSGEATWFDLVLMETGLRSHLMTAVLLSRAEMGVDLWMMAIS